MHFFWTYSGCDNAQEAEIAEAWRSRQAELESKAELAGGDQSTPVMVTVEHTDASPRWSIQCALYAPQATAGTIARANEIGAALDQLVGDLSQQIDEQISRPLTGAQRRQGLSALVPFLESFRREGMSGEFLATITPAVRSLNGYIRRELRTRRDVDEIPAGQTSPQDVMDDVLLRAWEGFEMRPKEQALDVWLISLIERALDHLGQPLTEQSLQERGPTDDNPIESDSESPKFESIEDAVETESIALAGMVAARPDVEPWDRLDTEARQVRLESMLRRLPREQRHALMLQAAEGFSQSEIADLQNRSEEDVAADLTAAKQEVRLMFSEENYVEIEEKLTRKALSRPRRSHRS